MDCHEHSAINERLAAIDRELDRLSAAVSVERCRRLLKEKAQLEITLKHATQAPGVAHA